MRFPEARNRKGLRAVKAPLLGPMSVVTVNIWSDAQQLAKIPPAPNIYIIALSHLQSALIFTHIHPQVTRKVVC